MACAVAVLLPVENQSAILGALLVVVQDAGGLAAGVRLLVPGDDDAGLPCRAIENHAERAVRLADVDPLHVDAGWHRR